MKHSNANTICNTVGVLTVVPCESEILGSESLHASHQSLMIRLCFSLVMALVAPAMCFADTGPLLRIPETMYDFGSVSQGQRVEHEFVIKNEGDADLVIQKLSPSCGCTAAAASSQAVKPGATEKIKVTFNTAGFHGQKTKSVSILTNSREQSEGTVQLRGTVELGVTLNPEHIDFGEISADTSEPLRTKEVSVEEQEGMGREIAAVRSVSPYLTVVELSSEGRRKRYAVKISPQTPRGPFRDRILLEFKNPEHAAINIPITATVVGELRLIPSTLSFGLVSGDQVIERRVRFENMSKTPVDIKEVKSSHPAVSASVVSVEPGKRSVVVVKLDPKKLSGDLKASIEVSTSHATESTLSLAVFGIQPPQQ